MHALNCPNCGAALPPKAIKASDLVTCEFCGTSFRVPKTLTPEPDMGDLLLGADFASNVLPGWEVMTDGKLTFRKNDPSELYGEFQPHINTYYVLKSSGFLDDFDAGISMRFTGGERNLIRAGFFLRFTEIGGYAVLVSVQGSYTIGQYVKGKEGGLVWEDLLPWTYHTALRAGLNETNRLRVLCQGEKFRIYLNGVLATSFKDSHFKRGKLHVAVVATEKSHLDIAFTDLQLREALGK